MRGDDMRGYLNKSNIIKFSVNTIMGIFTAISIISISTIMALNMKFIYKIIIEKYNLVSVTGISSNDLFLNYSKIINYLQNPFVNMEKFILKKLKIFL